MTWCMMVGEDTAFSKHLVWCLKCFYLIQGGGTKSTHIIWEVCEDMEFGFSNNTIGINLCPYVKDICNCNIKVSLYFCDWADSSTVDMAHLTVCWFISRIFEHQTNAPSSPVAFQRSKTIGSQPPQCRLNTVSWEIHLKFLATRLFR